MIGTGARGGGFSILAVCAPGVSDGVEEQSEHGFFHVHFHVHGVRRRVRILRGVGGQRGESGVCAVDGNGIIAVVQREDDFCVVFAGDGGGACDKAAFIRRRHGEDAVSAEAVFLSDAVLTFKSEAGVQHVALRVFEHEGQSAEGRALIDLVKDHAGGSERLRAAFSVFFQIHLRVGKIHAHGIRLDFNACVCGLVIQLVILVREVYLQLISVCISADVVALGIDVEVEHRVSDDGAGSCNIVNIGVFGRAVGSDTHLLLPCQYEVVKHGLRVGDVRNGVAVSDDVFLRADQDRPHRRLGDLKFGIRAVCDQARGLDVIAVALIDHDGQIHAHIGGGSRVADGSKDKVSITVLCRPLIQIELAVCRQVSLHHLLSAFVGDFSLFIHEEVIDVGSAAGVGHAPAVQFIRHLIGGDGVAVFVINGGVIRLSKANVEVGFIDDYLHLLGIFDVIVGAARGGDVNGVSARFVDLAAGGKFAIAELDHDVDFAAQNRRLDVKTGFIGDLPAEREVITGVSLTINGFIAGDESGGVYLGYFKEHVLIGNAAFQVVVPVGGKPDLVFAHAHDGAGCGQLHPIFTAVRQILDGKDAHVFCGVRRVIIGVAGQRGVFKPQPHLGEHIFRLGVAGGIRHGADVIFPGILLLPFFTLFALGRFNGVTVLVGEEAGRGGGDFYHALLGLHHDLQVFVFTDEHIGDIVLTNGRFHAEHLIIGVRDAAAVIAEQGDVIIVLTRLEGFFKHLIMTGFGGEFAVFQRGFERAVEGGEVKLRAERRGERHALFLCDGDVIFRRLLDKVPGVGERRILAVHAVEDKLKGVCAGIGDAVCATDVLRAVIIAVHVVSIDHVAFFIGDGEVEVSLIQHFVSDLFTEDGVCVIAAGDVDADRSR